MLEFGYIRLYRSLLNWEWYTDSNTKDLFIHLLLTANYEPKKWRGITVERGQRVYSRVTLSKELHMSEQCIRTALNHLISTGEVTSQATPQYSIVTIKNYDNYQQITSEITNDQPAINQPSTSHQPVCNKYKESNKARNIKDIYTESFENYAQGDELLLKSLLDFAEMRKAIKKPLSTERAVQMLLKKLDGVAGDIETKIAVLEQSMFHNWQSVFPLKGDNDGRSAGNRSDNGKSATGSTPEVPKYGQIF